MAEAKFADVVSVFSMLPLSSDIIHSMSRRANCVICFYFILSVFKPYDECIIVLQVNCCVVEASEVVNFRFCSHC